MQACFYIIVRNGFSICGSSALWLCARMVCVAALDIQVSLCNLTAMLEDSMMSVKTLYSFIEWSKSDLDSIFIELKLYFCIFVCSWSNEEISLVYMWSICCMYLYTWQLIMLKSACAISAILPVKRSDEGNLSYIDGLIIAFHLENLARERCAFTSFLVCKFVAKFVWNLQFFGSRWYMSQR